MSNPGFDAGWRVRHRVQKVSIGLRGSGLAGCAAPSAHQCDSPRKEDARRSNRLAKHRMNSAQRSRRGASFTAVRSRRRVDVGERERDGLVGVHGFALLA